MKTIYCYGDSNTYGYDPRSIFEDRYEDEIRWCDRLGKVLSVRVINGGENGRCVPRSSREYQALRSSLPGADILMILLGTNDLLMGRSPQDISAAMEALILNLRAHFPDLAIVLLAPPAMHLPELAGTALTQQLSQQYQALAAGYSLPFLPLGELPLGYDGVHLSEEGHRQLAAELTGFLRLEGLV